LFNIERLAVPGPPFGSPLGEFLFGCHYNTML
jgi:hypothetical protein